MVLAVVSLRHPDGPWAEVGTNLRRVIGPFGTERTIRRHAAVFAAGEPHRIEFHTGSILRPAYRTEECR